MTLDVSGSKVLYDHRNNPIGLEPLNEIVLGNIPLRSADVLSGFNKGVGTTEETLWSCGGLWNIHDDLEFISFVSTSTEDADGQTGGFGLAIFGIGDNWTEYSGPELLIIDGTTPVTTTRQYRQITRVAVIRQGSARQNIGDIEGTGVTTGFIEVCIPATYGLARQLVGPIPVNVSRILSEVSFSSTSVAGSNPKVVFRLRFHDFVNNFSIIVYEEVFDAGAGNIIIETPLNHTVLPGQAMIEATAISDKASTIIYARLKFEDQINEILFPTDDPLSI